MSYENTDVPVSRSQEGIRKLIMSRHGSKVAFISDPPQEGFEAVVMIDNSPYRIRIMGSCKEAPEVKTRHYMGRTMGSKETTEKFRNDFRIAEERRIWRVVYYHLKSVFEAADSGVMELRELLLPHIVTNDGHTVAEHILPKLAAAIAGNPARLLPAYTATAQ
jgi:hypothetical protein